MTTPAFKTPDAEFNALVHRYCTDLSARAAAGTLDPVIGRAAELDQIVTILLHRGRSNVALLGGAGTGKTALFGAVAQLIHDGQVPKPLQGARVLELDLGALGAGTDSRGELEGRLIPFIRGVGERNTAARAARQPTIIVCLDELHTIMRSCPASSASGIADLLKPYLTVGNLQVIGATTEVEYDDHVKQDLAVDRRFQKIVLKAPNLAETVTILKGIRMGYERHFNLTITDAACELTAKLATNYIKNRNNPDKSILALDGACARCVKDGHEGVELSADYIRRAVAAEIGVAPEVVI